MHFRHKQYVEADKTVFIGDLANHPLPFLEVSVDIITHLLIQFVNILLLSIDTSVYLCTY